MKYGHRFFHCVYQEKKSIRAPDLARELVVEVTSNSPLCPTPVRPGWWGWEKVLSRGEESCGEVGLNSGFSGFFMVGEDMSASGKTHTGTHKHTRQKMCTRLIDYSKVFDHFFGHVCTGLDERNIKVTQLLCCVNHFHTEKWNKMTSWVSKHFKICF